MHWHGGEQSGAGRRGRPDTSPDVKGVFGEGASVVAVAPASPQPSAARGAAALANLFNGDPRAGLELPSAPPRKLPRAESRGLWNSAPESSSSTSQMRPAVLPRAVLGRSDALPRSVPPPPPPAARAQREAVSGELPVPPETELRAHATSAHTEAAREPVTVTHDFDDESTTLYQRDEQDERQEIISARPEAKASEPRVGDEVITERPSQGPEPAVSGEVITARPEPEPAAPVPTPARSGRPSARASRPSRGSSPLFAANQGAGATASQAPNESAPSVRSAQRTFEPVPTSLRAAGDAPAASANDNASGGLDLERLAGAELARALSASTPNPSPSGKPRPRARARAGQAPPAPAPRSLPQWARLAIALGAIAFGLITFSIGVSMGVLRLPPKPAPASPALPPPSAAARASAPAVTPSAEAKAPADALAAQPPATTPRAEAKTAPADALGAQPPATTPRAEAKATPADALAAQPPATTPRAEAKTAPADALAAQPPATTPRAEAKTAPADVLKAQPPATTPRADTAAPEPQARAVAPHAAEVTPPPTAASPAAKPPAPSPQAHIEPPAPPPSAAATAIEDPARVVAQAWAQLRAKNPAAAEALMRPLLARDPDDHHAAEALAQALLEQSKPKEALRYIEQIVRKRPKRAAYRILLGDARQALGDQDGAVAAWQAALKWEPDNREAKRRLHLE